MKKLIILAVLAAMIFALAACAAPNEATPTAKPVATEEPTKEADPTPTEAPTPEPEPTDTPTPSPEPTAASIEKGTNVALTAEVDDYSSSTGEVHVQWGWSIENIHDGVVWDTTLEPPSLGWTTAVGVNFDDVEQEEYIIFELEKYTSIDTVNVCPTISGVFFPVDFHIEVSLDGKTYTTVASVEGCDRAAKGSDAVVTMTFDAVTAKYVKFVVTRLHDIPSEADGLLCQVGEIEIIAA